MNKINSILFCIKLSSRYCKQNLSRSIIVSISTAIITVLLLVLFHIALSTLATMNYSDKCEMGTLAEYSIENATVEQYNRVIKSDAIDHVGFLIHHQELIIDDDIYSIIYSNPADWESNRFPILDNFIGQYPVASNEVITSENVLHKLGYETLRIDMPISINVGNGEIHEFILSGYYTDDSINSASKLNMYVSSNFITSSPTTKDNLTIYFDVKNSTIVNEFDQMLDFIGLQGFINFDNQKLSALTNDAQLIYGQYPKPVLTSMSSELGSIYLFLMLPIICCGFILIYNCFILSLAQDRRDYAGLRCIGATKKQIKLLIVVQGLITGCLGVIIATIICFPIIQFCVPQIIEVLNVRTKHLIVSWSLFAFIMTYLVVTIIVILGCMLAYKNNNMSPITAKNYYEHRVKDIDRVTKKTNKKRLQKLFTYNFRDIIKTIFPSVLILIFGIVIFIIIDTVVLSMDTEKFENMYLSSYDMIYYYEESVQDIDSQTYSATNSFSDMYIDRIKDIVGSNNISIISEVNLKMKYDKKLLDKQLNYYAKTNKTSVQIDEYLDSKVIILDNIYIKFAMENNTYDVDWDRFGKGDFVLLGTDHSELFQSSMKLSGTIDGNDNEIYFNVEDFIPLYCENNEESACPYIYASETFMKKYDSAQIKKRRINIAIDNKNSDIKNELPSLGVQNQNVQIIDRVNLKNVIDSGRVLLKTGGYTYAILILIVGSISFVNTMILVASSRKKEFIIFRCIGMRVQQLYSLIIYESIKYSIIIGTTILLIGHIALFVTYKLFKNITGYAVFHYPVESILITIIGITVILILTPIVIIKKIRVDCISDILRR